MYDGRNIFTQTEIMIEKILQKEIEKCLSKLYGAIDQSIQFQKTRKDFNGDITLVVFPLLKASKKGSEETAEEIGNYLKEKVSEVTDFNVVKGFLNLCITSDFWYAQFVDAYNISNYGVVNVDENDPSEYSSFFNFSGRFSNPIDVFPSVIIFPSLNFN